MTLTAVQEKSVHALFLEGMEALAATDYTALKAALNRYIVSRHKVDAGAFWKVDVFTEGPLFYDSHVAGETWNDEHDPRMADLVVCATKPLHNRSLAAQASIAKLLGEFVLRCTYTDEQHPVFPSRDFVEWNHILITNMDKPEFCRQDLVQAFYLAKQHPCTYVNGIMTNTQPYSLISLYNWLLVTCDAWEKAWEIHGRYGVWIANMRDADFWLRESNSNQDDQRVKEAITHVNAMLPHRDAFGQTFPSQHFSFPSQHFYQERGRSRPMTLTKCTVMLVMFAHYLGRPATLADHVRSLRARQTRVWLYAFRFLGRLLTRVYARYKPTRVNGTDGLPGPGSVVPTARVAAFQAATGF